GGDGAAVSGLADGRRNVLGRVGEGYWAAACGDDHAGRSPVPSRVRASWAGAGGPPEGLGRVDSGGAGNPLEGVRTPRAGWAPASGGVRRRADPRLRTAPVRDGEQCGRTHSASG